MATRLNASWPTSSRTACCTCSATTTRRTPTSAACASARKRHSGHLALPVRRVVRSFGYAFEGVLALLRSTPNFWVHLFFALLALSVSGVLGLSGAELAVVVLTIALVLVVEAFNTALESLSDVASP